MGFKKTPEQGVMRNIAFALDPDGYWIELINLDPGVTKEDEKGTDVGRYRFNHTMLRVKNIEKSLSFYRSVLGMSQLRKHENPGGKFDLYFLGYRDGTEEEGKTSQKEGLLELTYNCEFSSIRKWFAHVLMFGRWHRNSGRIFLP